MGFDLFVLNNSLELLTCLILYCKMSLQTAEQDFLQRETSLKAGASGSAANKLLEAEETGIIDEPNKGYVY